MSYTCLSGPSHSRELIDTALHLLGAELVTADDPAAKWCSCVPVEPGHEAFVVAAPDPDALVELAASAGWVAHLHSRLAKAAA